MNLFSLKHFDKFQVSKITLIQKYSYATSVVEMYVHHPICISIFKLEKLRTSASRAEINTFSSSA